jgi:hypothetical protein
VKVVWEEMKKTSLRVRGDCDKKKAGAKGRNLFNQIMAKRMSG